MLPTNYTNFEKLDFIKHLIDFTFQNETIKKIANTSPIPMSSPRPTENLSDYKFIQYKLFNFKFICAINFDIDIIYELLKELDLDKTTYLELFKIHKNIINHVLNAYIITNSLNFYGAESDYLFKFAWIHNNNDNKNELNIKKLVGWTSNIMRADNTFKIWGAITCLDQKDPEFTYFNYLSDWVNYTKVLKKKIKNRTDIVILYMENLSLRKYETVYDAYLFENKLN